jgi:hypothetical protein
VSVELVLLVGHPGQRQRHRRGPNHRHRTGVVSASGDPAVVASTTDGDRNVIVRIRFAAAGFTELDYATLDRDSWPAVGVARYEGPPMPLSTDKQLFTFLR